jgi:hypothetical protein
VTRRGTRASTRDVEFIRVGPGLNIGRDGRVTGRDYLLSFALPNLFFHATTAYNILRHNGIELGKRNFLGANRAVWRLPKAHALDPPRFAALDAALQASPGRP